MAGFLAKPTDAITAEQKNTIDVVLLCKPTHVILHDLSNPAAFKMAMDDDNVQDRLRGSAEGVAVDENDRTCSLNIKHFELTTGRVLMGLAANIPAHSIGTRRGISKRGAAISQR